MAKSEGVKVVLKKVRLSFPRLDKPEAFEGGQPKYKGTFIVEDEATKKEIAAAVLQVGKAAFGDKFADKIRSGKLNNPIKKTDPEDNPGYPEGSVFIRATSVEQPGLVAVWRGKDGKPARVDADQFYAGCVVNVSLYCSSFDMPANKGVTFYLNNLQFVEDGERLDNRIAAEDEFEVDEDAEAPLDDLDDDANEDEDEDEDEDEEEEEKPKAKKTKKTKAKVAKEDDLSDMM
jgi:hypothetical protein